MSTSHSFIRGFPNERHGPIPSCYLGNAYKHRYLQSGYYYNAMGMAPTTISQQAPPLSSLQEFSPGTYLYNPMVQTTIASTLASTRSLPPILTGQWPSPMRGQPLSRGLHPMYDASPHSYTDNYA